MSGRDFKNFLSSHQYQMGRLADPKLISKVIDGTKIGTYKAVDYEHLAALTKLKKSSGERSLKRLEKITKASQEKKETTLIQHHKKAWQKEQVKLKHTVESLEKEVDVCISKFCDSELTFLTDLYFEMTSLAESLKDSRIIFQNETIQPILDLRDDLQYWIRQNREKLLLRIASEEHQEVENVITSVKEQQEEIIEKLNADEELLQSEIDLLMCRLGIEQVDVKFPHVLSGIPNSACELECFDEDLKGNCLAEFHNLDYKYELRFKYLEEKYSDAIKMAPTGGWSVQDNLHFQHILEQYADEKHDKRMLYIDRMTRELAHKSRRDIILHEDWWFAFRSFQHQFRDHLHTWQRDREDLFLKIAAVFAEANAEYETSKERFADRMKQKKMCEQLHEKVKEFQIQKNEITKLEALAQARKEDEENEARRKEEQKEKTRRNHLKMKLDKYHDEKEQRRQLEAKREEERLAELKERLEEQKIIDKERIKYRENLLLEKEEELRLKKEREKELEKEKEERLDKLRKQVRVEIEDNPTRHMEPTEAFQAKQAAKFDEERELQEPLFPLHTFNTNQVDSDQRLKIETALRKAGLHTSDYARSIISKVAPPTVPRKDTTSTVFKNN